MDKQQIVDRLLALPAEIAKAEETVLEANLHVLSAKGALQEKEDMLLLSNAIEGKNAEIRGAQMREKTVIERGDLDETEIHLKNAVTRLVRLRDEFRALQAVVDLLKGAA